MRKLGARNIKVHGQNLTWSSHGGWIKTSRNGTCISAELELLAQGLILPPSLNCPGARGEGGLTEAASSGGAPAAEATTVLGTTGWITHPGVSQLPCHEDTQATLRRDPCGKELRPPTYSHVSETSQKSKDLILFIFGCVGSSLLHRASQPGGLATGGGIPRESDFERYWDLIAGLQQN